MALHTSQISLRSAPPHSVSRSVRGFTLIEVLVALTITLVLTALVAEVLQRTADSINHVRSQIDLADQLRNAKHRLILDLRGATAPTTPPLEPHKHLGYFEYVEGPNVANTSGGDAGTAVTGGRNTVNGDLDDVLMFTTASFDERFVGRAGVKSGLTVGIKARFAEIAWCLKPVANTEFFTLHRRVWLIVPNQTVWGSDYASVDASMRQENGWHDPDAVPESPTPPVINNGFAGTPPPRLVRSAVFNTLGDLTHRERRSVHQPYVWPHRMMLIGGSGSPPQLALPSLGQQSNGNFPNPLCETADFREKTVAATPSPTPPYISLNGNTGNGSRIGEDVILTNVVGFDVKAWDPGAPVFLSMPHPTAPNNTGIIGPGDAGYLSSVDRFNANPLDGTRQPVAFGAFADLNYMSNFGSSGAAYTQRYNNYAVIKNCALERCEKSLLKAGAAHLPRPFFAHPGHVDCALAVYASGSPAVYDTWSTHYEHDGMDNNGRNGADEGTNGVDDNGNGLVDEPDPANGERDAPPPFAAPLRGLQITLRVMEQDSKQVRQVTILHEFVP